MQLTSWYRDPAQLESVSSAQSYLRSLNDAAVWQSFHASQRRVA